MNPRTLETTARLDEIAQSVGVSSPLWRWRGIANTTSSPRPSLGQPQSQLDESLEARDLVLDQETLDRIDELDVEIPNPMTEDGLRRL